MTFRLWPSTRRDVQKLSSFMRESDRAELTFNAKATGRFGPGWSIHSDLEKAFASHELWSILKDVDVVAVGGILAAPHDPRTGIIWMLGTDLADTHWREMTRLCRRWLDMHLSRYDRVGNVLPTHMMQRRRWLEHLGFDMVESEAQLHVTGLVSFWQQSDTAPRR